MTAPREVRVGAPAKVNLRLDVLGRRADGYHEVDTVLAALELADELVVERLDRAPGVSLEVLGPTSPGVPSDASNLAVRAARAVLDLVPGTAPGLGLRLEKRVPAGAGLGGGSSNAAAAAFGAALVLGLDPEDPRILGALAELGSDCPFFLAGRRGGVARGLGRGERIEPLAGKLPELGVLVVAPDLEVPTPGVYAAFAGAPTPPARPAFPASLPATLSELRAQLGNHLEDPACELHPRLAAWRALFRAAGAGHLMLSGSGSSFFGLFPDVASARVAGEGLRAAGIARDLGLRLLWSGPFAGRGTHLK